MTSIDHQQLIRSWTDVLSRADWERIGEFVHDDAVFEFPQSGETFRGLANICAQFENYPGLETATQELDDIVGGSEYVMTPRYTVVAIDGGGGRGTAVIRVRYPDRSRWWAVNLYELRDGRIGRSRTFFAPEFDPPDWRAPYREEG